jgi:site-specific DNA-methyltransferase (adenine-specific)
VSVEPYFSDEHVTLYHGDMREILPALGVQADCIVADPPYGETSLAWDKWPEGWLEVAASVTRSLWCFGTLRMYLEHRDEFKAAGWKLGQDVIWEKHNGSSLANDRFRRVHEQVTHWYRGGWGAIHHDAQGITEATASRVQAINRGPTPHLATDGAAGQTGGTALMRSVLRVHSMHGRAIHRTEKPTGLLSPLISYACPPGGVVLDPFAGSGSTLDAARMQGRRAIGIELYEPHVEAAAKRLSQMVLEAS